MESLTAPGFLSMLGLFVRATILLSAALALAWLARKGPAGVRHLLWTMTFALLLGLPVLSLLGPSWEVPILPSLSGTPRQPPTEAVPVHGAPSGFITLPAPGPSLPDAESTVVPVGEAFVAIAPDPPSTPALGSRLRRRAGLAGPWAGFGSQDLFARHIRFATLSGFDKPKRFASGWRSAATCGSS